MRKVRNWSVEGALVQKILDRENVIPNVGALAVKKPKIQV